MKALRFADLSLVVKMALAPAFAVVMLAVVTGGAYWSQQQQARALDRIVERDLQVSLELAAISRRIAVAHLKIYQLLTNQAGAAAADPQLEMASPSCRPASPERPRIRWRISSGTSMPGTSLCRNSALRSETSGRIPRKTGIPSDSQSVQQV